MATSNGFTQINYNYITDFSVLFLSNRDACDKTASTTNVSKQFAE